MYTIKWYFSGIGKWFLQQISTNTVFKIELSYLFFMCFWKLYSLMMFLVCIIKRFTLFFHTKQGNYLIFTIWLSEIYCFHINVELLQKGSNLAPVQLRLYASTAKKARLPNITELFLEMKRTLYLGLRSFYLSF